MSDLYRPHYYASPRAVATSALLVMTLAAHLTTCQVTTTTPRSPRAAMTVTDIAVTSTVPAPDEAGAGQLREPVPSVSEELARLVSMQFIYKQREPGLRRKWLADEDLPLDEYEAAFMVHDSLLSHVATVRCPAYAMVFSWFEDERLYPQRAMDQHRLITRRHIQMLAYRVVVEPSFYHDIYFRRTFGRRIRSFMNVISEIERQLLYTAQIDTWYDLISCLYEYGNAPPPQGPEPTVRNQLNDFLTETRRRRMAMRLRRVYGQRNQRLFHQDMERVHNLASSLPDFELITEATVEAMMSEFAHQLYTGYRRAHPGEWQPIPAIENAWVLWPPADEPVPQYDPNLDMKLKPALIYHFRSDEQMRWAAVRRPRIEQPARGEPYRSPTAPGPARQHPLIDTLRNGPPRTERQQLEDIAAYYQLRMRLVVLFEQSHDHRLILWSRLKLESAIELAIISELSEMVRNRVYTSTSVQMVAGLAHYRSLAMRINMLAEQARTYGPQTVKAMLELMRPTLNYLAPFFDITFLKQMLGFMMDSVDLMALIEHVYHQPENGESDDGDEQLQQQPAGQVHMAESSAAAERRAEAQQRTEEGRNVRQRPNTPEEEEECSICLSALSAHAHDPRPENRNSLVPIRLHCGHKFHLACMHRWFRQSVHSRRCPICRAGPEAN